MSKTFGKELRGLRKDHKLTLVELAEITGLSQPYLSQIENGKIKNLSANIIMKISSGLNVEFNDLWIPYVNNVQKEQNKFLKEEKDENIKNASETLLKGNEEVSLFKKTLSIEVPARIEYENKEDHTVSKITKEEDLFDLFYLLNMDTELYYKNKEISVEDKKFILQMLERTLS